MSQNANSIELQRSSLEASKPLLGSDLVSKDEEQPTPLPVVQVAILVSLRTLVPVSFTNIFPYINQLVSDIPNSPAAGDKASLGYYVGVIEGIFLFSMCLISIPFGRAADRFGRKPMLLFGLAGAAISCLAFGFAQSLTTLILARAVAGLTNGSVSILRTCMAEICDTSNRSLAFSFFPLAFASGTSLGALIGGILYAKGSFLPALPPCTAAAGLTVLGFLAALFGLKETLSTEKRIAAANRRTSLANLFTIITPRLWIILLNYALISFINASLLVVLPLFAFTPTEYNGLGWSEKRIGTLLAIQSVPLVIIQLWLFPRAVQMYGSSRLYLRTAPAFVLIFALLPLLPVLQRSLGEWAVWIGLFAYMLLNAFADWVFTIIVLMVNGEGSKTEALGAINGFAVMVNTAFRAAAAPASSGLYAWSISQSFLDGQSIWICMCFLSCVTWAAGCWLPADDADDAKTASR